MRCGQLESLLLEGLADKPSPEVEEHLAGCARCRAQREALARSSRWLELLRQEPPELSRTFWIQLRERLESSDAPTAFWVRLVTAGRLATLAVAVAVLLVALGVIHHRAEPSWAELEAPPTTWEELAAGGSSINGGPSPDQVMLTLVSPAEPQP
jgi:predicted anti-sigma-YlaC factor YlaD